MIQVDAMFPVMVTKKLEELKSYYQTHFGFEAVFYQPDFYLHLTHPQNGIQLGFLVPDHPSQPNFLHSQLKTEGYVISLEVQNAQTAWEQAQEVDLKVAMPIKHEEWGQIHFILEDPAGFKLDLVQHVN